MKPAVRLVLTFAGILVATPTASARHCKMRAPMYPVAPAPVVPFAMPAPVAASGFGGASLQMQFAMSGDASMLVMAPLFLRVIERLLLPAAGGRGDAEMQSLIERILGLAAGGAGLEPQLKALLLRAAGGGGLSALTEPQLRDMLRQELIRALKDFELDRKGEKPSGRLSPLPVSPELERARADVARQLAEIETRQRAWGNAPAVAKSTPRTEVERLLADIESKQARWKTAPVAVGNR